MKNFGSEGGGELRKFKDLFFGKGAMKNLEFRKTRTYPLPRIEKDRPLNAKKLTDIQYIDLLNWKIVADIWIYTELMSEITKS